MEALLNGLDKRRSYFSVVHFAGLIAKEQVAIPCDLKLTLFIGGGPEDNVWAPHVNYVPIPLLLKVRVFWGGSHQSIHSRTGPH